MGMLLRRYYEKAEKVEVEEKKEEVVKAPKKKKEVK